MVLLFEFAGLGGRVAAKQLRWCVAWCLLVGLFERFRVP